MAWITPKTDWKPIDPFDLDPDYTRIRGNILHLHAMAARLHLPFSLAQMPVFTIQDVPGLSFFANVSGNVDTLLDATFRPFDTPHGQAYHENGAIWDAEDLNRIEEMQLLLYENMAVQEAARPTLKFTLGGGTFGSAI